MSQTVVLTRSAQFNPFANRYKCCCNWCMAQDGTLLLATLEVLSIVISVLIAFIDLSKSNANADYDYITLFIASASVVTLTLLYFGFKRNKASFLLPHIIKRVCLIFFLIVVISMIMGARITFPELHFQGPGLTPTEKETKFVALGYNAPAKIFLGLMVILLESWMLWVNIKCYRFLKDKTEYLQVAQSDISSNANGNHNQLEFNSHEGKQPVNL